MSSIKTPSNPPLMIKKPLMLFKTPHSISIPISAQSTVAAQNSTSQPQTIRTPYLYLLLYHVFRTPLPSSHTRIPPLPLHPPPPLSISPPPHPLRSSPRNHAPLDQIPPTQWHSSSTHHCKSTCPTRSHHPTRSKRIKRHLLRGNPQDIH